jgi:hypothetical protein
MPWVSVPYKNKTYPTGAAKRRLRLRTTVYTFVSLQPLENPNLIYNCLAKFSLKKLIEILSLIVGFLWGKRAYSLPVRALYTNHGPEMWTLRNNEQVFILTEQNLSVSTVLDHSEENFFCFYCAIFCQKKYLCWDYDGKLFYMSTY